MFNNKQAFDPTVCFTFFGSWVRTIEKLENAQDKNSNAYTLFKAIADYCMYGIDPDFSNNQILDAIWVSIERDADSSMSKRKRQFDKDEIDKNVEKVMDIIIKNNDKLSLRQIEELTGVDKNKVSRIKKTYQIQIEDAIKRNCADSIVTDTDIGIGNGNDTGNDNGNGNDTGNDNGNGNDIMGQDRDRTVGQLPDDDLFVPKEKNYGEKTIHSLEEEIHVLESNYMNEYGYLEDSRLKLSSEKEMSERYGNRIDQMKDYIKRIGELMTRMRHERESNASFLRSEYASAIRSTLPKNSIDVMKVMAILKKCGVRSKYGVWIDGWNEELQRPNLIIALYPLPLDIVRKQRHNLEGIPKEFYLTPLSS